jgi:hypothetical protein
MNRDYDKNNTHAAGAQHRGAAHLFEFDSQLMLRLGAAAALGEKKKCWQRRAKVGDNQAVEQTHQAELAGPLLVNIFTESREK